MLDRCNRPNFKILFLWLKLPSFIFTIAFQTNLSLLQFSISIVLLLVFLNRLIINRSFEFSQRLQCLLALDQELLPFLAHEVFFFLLEQRHCLQNLFVLLAQLSQLACSFLTTHWNAFKFLGYFLSFFNPFLRLLIFFLQFQLFLMLFFFLLFFFV